VVAVKALACELPSEAGLPFSRFSGIEIAREAVRRGIVASISGRTVWRWLDADAIRPWAYRSWIFPRDERFAEKAGQVLDLYQGVWEGAALGSDDYVISADEKTSIQARPRVAEGQGPAAGRLRRVEFEYQRGGALVPARRDGGVGRSPGQGVRAVRPHDGHRTLPSSGGPGDGAGALSFGPARVLDRG
jgi:hypothetical protein